MITDYASLQTAIGNWLNKSTLTARIPEFIELAEARFRRKLDDADQDTQATITFTGGIASLPADFGMLREIGGTFDQNPITFEIVGSQVETSPAVDGPATIVYKAALPGLSNTVTTNWLLNRAPDIYLFGALLQAEFFGWNDERLPLIKASLDEAIQELELDSDKRRWGTTPIAPRIGRDTAGTISTP